MFGALILFIIGIEACMPGNDPASLQLSDYKNKTKGSIELMTTGAGAPVDYRDATSTLNTDLLINEHLMDILTHAVRERIPDRMVHANGNGAFGYFETTHDISHICKAKVFKLGEKTPVGVRFSLAFSNRGVRETTRDIRGFAIKFYTKDGIFDIVGFNTPFFPFKDPLLFSPLSHVFRRNPVTNLPDPNSLWDYITQQPESIFSFLHFYSDRLIPFSYRHMPGFSIHTYQVYNKKGEIYFVRFHFLPDESIKNFNATEAAEVSDPDYYTRDLYNAIAKGKYPSWQLKMQVLSWKDMENADIDIFDITKELPVDKYPLHPVGKLVLNRNPFNYFAEIEQLAFCPGNVVPGILGSPDKIFESRRFSYRDAQNYRLGANFKKIKVNRPLGVEVRTYTRNGAPPLYDNAGGSPNYYPNSYNGPIPSFEENRPSLIKIYEREPNNFEQASNFYSNELTRKERSNLIETIVANICPVETIFKIRAVKWFKLINSDLGNRVAKSLVANCPDK